MSSIPLKPLEFFNELENLPWFENIGKHLQLEPEIQALSVQCESLKKPLKAC